MTTAADEALELDIRREADAWMREEAAGNRQQASAHWREMVRLIHSRSPAQVRKMEVEQGLI